MSFSDEIRGAVKAFHNAQLSLSSVERLTRSLELIADRMEGEGVDLGEAWHLPSIPIPQHSLRVVKS